MLPVLCLLVIAVGDEVVGGRRSASGGGSMMGQLLVTIIWRFWTELATEQDVSCFWFGPFHRLKPKAASSCVGNAWADPQGSIAKGAGSFCLC